MLRSARVVSAAALSLALLSSVARAQSVEQVNLGDTLTGTTGPGLKEVVPFNAVEGTLFDVDLRMAPGSAPNFVLLNPDRTPYPGLDAFKVFDSRGSKVTAKKIPLLDTGRHYLLIQPGTEGAYTLKIKGKPRTRAGRSGLVLPAPPTEVEIGGVPGALLTITAKRGKKSALFPLIVFVEGPSGLPLDLGTAASHKITVASDSYKDLPLDELGTYVVGVGSQTGVGGDLGVITVSVKLPRPKPEKRNDSLLVVDPLVDFVAPSTGFDNLAYAAVSIQGDYFALDPAVRLEGASETIQADSVTRLGPTGIVFDVDLAGHATGVYDVVVTHPDGGEGRLVGGFTIAATPLPALVTPSSCFDNEVKAATVSGTRFQPGLSVVFLPQAGGSPVQATVGTVTSTTAAVSADFRDRPLGAWDVRVVNPDGGENTATSVFTVNRAPRVLGANPALGHDNEGALAVAVSGLSFQAGVTCRLQKTGSTDIVGSVSGVTPTSFTATFNLQAAPAGNWTLRATNPDGGTTTLAAPFPITRAPRVFTLSTYRGFDTDTLAGVVVTGTDFVAGAQVDLTQSGSPTVAATAEVVGGGGTTVTGTLPLTGAAVGSHYARVTNPDGGRETLPLAFSVLGTRTLSGGTTGGAPVFAFNATNQEYLAVYSVSNGTQGEIRAQRLDAVTGAPVGAEIVVADSITDVNLDGSTVEDKTAPSVAWSASLGRYLVVYLWAEPSSAGDRFKVLGQLVRNDGTVDTPAFNAHPFQSAPSGTFSRPRVAWNPTRAEWLVVWAYDASSPSTSVNYARLDNQVPPSAVSSGALVPTGPDAGGNEVFYRDPDVAYSASAAEYGVTFTSDVVEMSPGQGQPVPPDTGTDVQARFFRASDMVQQANLTTLGNVSGKSEGRSRVAFDSNAGNWLVAWEYPSGAGDTDIRAWRVAASTHVKVGASVTTVEQNATTDAKRPALAYDDTAASRGWLVAYEYAGNSVVVTRLAQNLTGPVHKTVAAALAGATFTLPAVAARASGAEFLCGWAVGGNAASKAGVNAEARFAK